MGCLGLGVGCIKDMLGGWVRLQWNLMDKDRMSSDWTQGAAVTEIEAAEGSMNCEKVSLGLY